MIRDNANTLTVVTTDYTWFIQNYGTQEFMLIEICNSLNEDEREWVFPTITIEKGDYRSFEEECEIALVQLRQRINHCFPTDGMQRVATLHPKLGSINFKEHFSLLCIHSCPKNSDIIDTKGIKKIKMFPLEEIKKLKLAFGENKIIPILEDFLSPPTLFFVKDTC
ncbi:MAG: hypothetical protein ACE5F2_02660 [Candidatus Paceibacteria bacterium]